MQILPIFAFLANFIISEYKQRIPRIQEFPLLTFYKTFGILLKVTY